MGGGGCRERRRKRVESVEVVGERMVSDRDLAEA